MFAPTTPGSIQEGGELGYSLQPMPSGPHLDNPILIVACVIGDGEAETGPVATQSNKFSTRHRRGRSADPSLNGTRSAPHGPGRIEHEELEQFFRVALDAVLFVEGDEPETMHQLMAATMEEAIQDIRQNQKERTNTNDAVRRVAHDRPQAPKGWDGTESRRWPPIEGTSERIRCRSSWISGHPVMWRSLKVG